jgi:hypothetical protein
MSLKIGQYIVHKLSGVTANLNAVGFPEDTLKPFIAYKRKNVDCNYTKDTLRGNMTIVEISIFTPDYLTGVNMAQQVRDILECKTGSYAGIVVSECTLTNVPPESRYNELYVQVLEFTFKTN